MQKKCNHCGYVGPAGDFAVDNSYKDGRRPLCKWCNALKVRQWQATNREKYGVLLFNSRARRRAREAGAEGRFDYFDWLSLVERYDHRCLCCGHRGKVTIDHVVPLSKGGANDVSNLQPLCMRCNTRKGVQTIDYRPRWGNRGVQ